MRVVASEIDDSTERIIRYLSDAYGVDINAVRFQFFEADGRQLLVRTFTVAPEEAETNINKTPGKRKPSATLEELREIALQKGVGPLYDLCSEMLTKYFRKGKTTQNNLMFNATFPDGSKKVLVSLGAARKQLGSWIALPSVL